MIDPIPRDAVPTDPELLRRMDEVEGWAVMGPFETAAKAMAALPMAVKESNPIWLLETWAKIFAGQKRWPEVEEMARQLTEAFPHRPYGFEILVEALREQKTPLHLQQAEEVRIRGARTLLDLAKASAKAAVYHDLVRPCLEGAIRLEPRMRTKIAASKRLSKFLRT